MNSTITFPPAEPTLKLTRPSAEKWAATLAEERRRLQEDHDALREREQNLREYESRLRALQAEIDAGRAVSAAPAAPGARVTTLYPRSASQAPFHDDPGLQAGWEKLHRAREILEAEERNMRDDRIAMREMETQIKRREEAVTAREQLAAEREALIVAATPPPQPMSEEEPEPSTVTKFTRGPFNMARSVFRGKK